MPVVLQTAAAAVAAWYLALLLLPSPRPAFASIAAVICLGATYGQRRRAGGRAVGGVVIGLARRERAARADRHRPAADRAARDRSPCPRRCCCAAVTLLVNEAAISAILLASLQQADARLLRRPHPRGPDRRRRRASRSRRCCSRPIPSLMVNRAAQSVVGKLGHTLEEAAGALEAGDTGRAEQALHAARGIDDDVDALEDDRSPPRTRPRASRSPAAATASSCAATRRRCRRSTSPSATRACSPATSCATRAAPSRRPPGCRCAVRELADAVWELGAQYDEPERRTRAAPARAQRRPPRDHALRRTRRADADRRPGALGRRRPRARRRAARRAGRPRLGRGRPKSCSPPPRARAGTARPSPRTPGR